MHDVLDIIRNVQSLYAISPSLGILKDFSDISKLNKNDPQYDYLKDKIINVNEYNII